MFEKFTEDARRSIFFARYEASQTGSSHIETEHLLLGLLREDRLLRSLFPRAARQQVRKTVEERLQTGQRVPTTSDLPLSQECQRALGLGAEEAEALGHGAIRGRHLVLGLLRVEESGAAGLLREHSIDLASFRERVKAAREDPTLEPAEELEPETDSQDLPEIPARLSGLLLASTGRLGVLIKTGDSRLKRHNWTRREAMGHLIDWAAAHQCWFARALTEPRVIAAGYPSVEWVAAERYNEMPWGSLQALWLRLNRLLIHVMAGVPEARLQVACKIGVDDAIPLEELMKRYVDYVEELLAEILMRS